jgi:protein-glutamine gamma-glutamyltransferase
MKTQAVASSSAWLMLAAFAAGAALHADRTAVWCSAFAGFALLWYGLHITSSIALPGRAIRMVVTVAAVAGVALSFRTLTGLAAGSALLIVMGAAKLLETRTARDALVVAMVSLMLLLAACLDRQSLLRVPLYAISAWIAIAAIAALGATQQATGLRSALHTAARSLAVALPLGLLCFVLVPRLPSGLWSLPNSDKATTGLSDEMSPGSISELSLSDAIAFRVRFDQAVPPSAQRYWRGPVLHDFDGTTWRRRRGQLAMPPKVTTSSDPVSYEVMLEPHNREYLFALETTQAITGRRHLATFDGQFLAVRPVSTAISYRGAAALQVRYSDSLTMLGRRIDLTLPPDRNPRTIALAKQLRAQAASDAAYSKLVLDYFRNSGFEYTLTPPRLGIHSVDDLIFNTKLGFCGHFASAFVTLMRAAGVPARVVTGYLGGEWNGYGGYYVVRQSNAHAWAELWIDGTGWVRADPTAVVAPARLQSDLRDILPGSSRIGSLRRAPWLLDLRDTWDAASTWWQQQVVEFDLAKQAAFFERLGIPNIDYRKLALMLLTTGAAWLALVWWHLRRSARSSSSLDAVAKLWRRYTTLLQQAGVATNDFDAPRDIARRASTLLPHAATSIQAFTDRYVATRFGKSSVRSPTVMDDLRRALRQLARDIRAQRRPQTGAAATK